jgi:hypothetical protein
MLLPLVVIQSKKVRFAVLVVFIGLSTTVGLNLSNIMERKTLLKGLSTLFMAASLPQSAQSLAFNPQSTVIKDTEVNGSSRLQYKVAYKPLTISVEDDSTGIDVPVACWFPLRGANEQDGGLSTITPTSPKYKHRISVRKIGQLLANWNIPSFVSRNYSLRPTSDFVADGTNLPLPTWKAPVVLLAHGYLGSRFDLSHLAEELAEQGFICMAAEYPESLAASYDPMDGVDRRRINQVLLDTLNQKWKIQASSFGIVGHSLGCGTALQTGDKSWTRVLISGFPRQRDGSPVTGNLLLLASMNDGVVNKYLANQNAIPSDFVRLDEASVFASSGKLPRRSVLIFDRPDAPNHISFLSESVNDAMVEFLSPLLPVARLFGIPVLDFDRYQESRDSKVTAGTVHPIILRYLTQEMGGSRI